MRTERILYKSMQGLLFICWYVNGQLYIAMYVHSDKVPCKLVNSSFNLLSPNGRYKGMLSPAAYFRYLRTHAGPISKMMMVLYQLLVKTAAKMDK